MFEASTRPLTFSPAQLAITSGLSALTSIDVALSPLDVVPSAAALMFNAVDVAPTSLGVDINPVDVALTSPDVTATSLDVAHPPDPAA